MAASTSVALVPGQAEEKKVNPAMTLTGAEHIARLHRPGAKYFNMNPFDVLMLDPEECVQEDVRKHFKRMSVQVHPDKNPDDVEQANSAFEIVQKAAKQLESEKEFQFCKRICEGAKSSVKDQVKKAKKKARKEGLPEEVPEDDPAKFKMAVTVTVSKMFAEFESRKGELEEKDLEDKKRKREEELQEELLAKIEKKEKKVWEKTRQKRVNGWRNWAGNTKLARPPKIKEETRGGDGSGSAYDRTGESWKRDWR